MKKWFVVAILLVCSVNAYADVILPESRRLAGPLNSQASEYGQEFLFFPDFMLPGPPVPLRSELTGWVEVEFDEPQGNSVTFFLNYYTVGTDTTAVFGGGQVFEFSDQRTMADTRARPLNTGRLDLETGEVTFHRLAVLSFNRTSNRLARNNRLYMGFIHGYPERSSALGYPIDEFTPESLATEMRFFYDGEGRITGFEFLGQSLGPVAWVAFSNSILEFFPSYFFGTSAEGYWPNPDSCLPGTPPENCPNDEDNPETILLPLEMTLHPHFFLRSDEMREVPTERPLPPCAPPDMAADGVVAAAGGKLYMMGGVSGGQVTDAVHVYDPSTETWEAGTPLPTAVTEAQAAVVESRIYVIGGRQTARGPASGRVQIFNTETGRWSQGPSAPSAIARGTTAVFGAWIHVFGGRTNRANGSPSGNLRLSDQVQIYSAESNSWTAMRAVFGRSIFAERPSAVAVGSDIYLIGGRNLDDEVSSQVTIFNALTRTFRAGPSLQWGVYDAAAGLVGNRLYLVGGRREVGGPSDTGVQVLEPIRGEWLKWQKEPLPVAGSQGAVLYGSLYIVGARAMSAFDDYPGPPTRAMQALDPAQGWAVCDTQPLFTSGDVVNTASLVVGQRELSPGSQASLLGYNLAPQVAVAPAGPVVPTELTGVSLTVDGLPAPILAVEPERVDFQIPYGVATGGKVAVELRRADTPQQAPAMAIPIVDLSPGIFLQNCAITREVVFLERATALACNADGTLNYATNAVRPGEVVKIQMTGLGPVTPALANGERATAEAPPAALVEPTVFIRGASGEQLEAEVLSVTLAPGEVGIYDVEIVVPPNTLVGPRVKVEVMVDGLLSNAGVISVGEPTAEEPITCQRDSFPDYRHCVDKDGVPAPPEP